MIFFDSYAILEIMRGNTSYKQFGDQTFVTNTLNLAEVLYSLLKESGEKKARKIIKTFNFEFMEIPEVIAIESAVFRYKNKARLSYADCIGYITAQKHRLRFLTGDKQFKGMKYAVYVK